MCKQAVELHFNNSARKDLERIDLFIFVNYFIALFSLKQTWF